ncbi:MAG: hypothetical protein E7485_05660 [Ruminococcaceae bacterium]|nr:hypothetical protein [Oscillospiraceae bacterium]
MAVLSAIISAAMLSIFVQNAIFERAFGSNVAIYASRRESHIIGFSLGITAMTTAASVATYFLDGIILPMENGWLFMPLIYVGVISVLYIIALLVMWRFMPKLFVKIRKYAHLAVFNCTVIGALFLNSGYGGDLLSYIGYGIGTGIGFFLASLMLSIAREKLDSDKIPKAFRGYPIMLIYIGVVSLAFYALVGYTVDF